MDKTQITDNTPIAMLTISQLTSYLRESLFPKPLLDLLERQIHIEEEKKSKRYVHGVAGIKSLFNCGYPTAHKLKETIIKPAVHQQGRVILVDVELVLKLFEESKTVHSIKAL